MAFIPGAPRESFSGKEWFPLARAAGLQEAEVIVVVAKDEVDVAGQSWAPRRREAVIERELPGELVLYDPETDHAFLLNHATVAIWDLCDGRRSERQIAERIARDFNVPCDVVLEDVGRAIAQLRGDKLLA